MHAITRLLAVGLAAAVAASAVQAQQARRIALGSAGTTSSATVGIAPGAPTGPRTIVPELFPAETSPGSPPGVAPPATTLLLPDGTSVIGTPATAPTGSRVTQGPVVPGSVVLASALTCGASASDEVRAFLYADGDQDCRLSRTEALLLGPTARTFDEMDRNSDGFVTREEFDASLR